MKKVLNSLLKVTMLFSLVMKIYLDFSETIKSFHSLTKWKFKKNRFMWNRYVKRLCYRSLFYRGRLRNTHGLQTQVLSYFSAHLITVVVYERSLFTVVTWYGMKKIEMNRNIWYSVITRAFQRKRPSWNSVLVFFFFFFFFFFSEIWRNKIRWC